MYISICTMYKYANQHSLVHINLFYKIETKINLKYFTIRK